MSKGEHNRFWLASGIFAELAAVGIYFFGGEDNYIKGAVYIGLALIAIYLYKLAVPSNSSNSKISNTKNSDESSETSVVTIPKMPYAPEISQIIYLTNMGDSTGNAEVEVRANGEQRTFPLGNIGRDQTPLAGTIRTFVVEMIGNKSDNVSLIIRTNVPACDIYPTVAYNVNTDGGNGDRINMDFYTNCEDRQ